MPILLAAGAEDPVGEMSEGVKKLYKFYQEKAGVKDIELKLFEGCRHEFLNEKSGEENARAILEWFEKRC